MAVNSTGFDYTSIGLRTGTETGGVKKKELGQEDFMRLMIEQFRHQDPFKPMENGEFLGQLAQFSSVAGLTELKQSFADLSASMSSSQTLQASSLLGREVLVENSRAKIGATGGIEGAVDLDSSTSSAIVQVTDSSGALVRRIYLGEQSAGMAKFSWDGKNENGARVAPGTYTVKGYAVDGGEAVAAPVLTSATVESVTLGGAGQGGIRLSVTGLGEVAFSQVRQIS